MAKKLTTETFIQKAREVHGDKYDYSKVNYINSYTKVEIICPIHGSFWQTPGHHLHGEGCKHCHRKNFYTTEIFIEKAKQIHGNKYDYSKVEYKGNKIKVCIICPEHGEFWQEAHSHLQGHGCPQCAKKLISNQQRLTTEEFVNRAKNIHNNIYDYSKINYINLRTPVTIICMKHGEFQQTPEKHLLGRGCRKCKLKSQTKLFEKLKESFPNEEILFEVDKSIVPWLGLQRFDIYFPKYNIAVEYNGQQHYIPIEYFGGELKLKEQINYDSLKRQKCYKNKCFLIEVKYDYSEKDYNEMIEKICNIITINKS